MVKELLSGNGKGETGQTSGYDEELHSFDQMLDSFYDYIIVETFDEVDC